MPRRRRPSRSVQQKMDALWASLPAATVREVARRMTDQLGRLVTVSEVFRLISYLRKHCVTFGWTVLHVSRKEGIGDKYTRIRVEPDGTFVMTDEILANAHLGEAASMLHCAQRCGNSASAMRALTQQMTPGTERFKVDAMAEDADDLRRKIERHVRFIREPAANGAANG